MVALASRAEIVAHEDHYLAPLLLTGETAQQVEAWIGAVVEGEQSVTLIWEGRLKSRGSGVAAYLPCRAWWNKSWPAWDSRCRSTDPWWKIRHRPLPFCAKGQLHQHLNGKYILQVWREMNSSRDTTTPNTSNALAFLQSLLQEESNDDAA